MSAKSRSPSAGVSDEVGSSRMRRCGGSAIAFASSTSCCSPLRKRAERRARIDVPEADAREQRPRRRVEPAEAQEAPGPAR